MQSLFRCFSVIQTIIVSSNLISVTIIIVAILTVDLKITKHYHNCKQLVFYFKIHQKVILTNTFLLCLLLMLGMLARHFNSMSSIWAEFGGGRHL